MTDSMKRAIDETDRRRAIQEAYNQEHGITPESIIRPLSMSLAGITEADYVDMTEGAEACPSSSRRMNWMPTLPSMESDMREAAKSLTSKKPPSCATRCAICGRKSFYLRNKLVRGSFQIQLFRHRHEFSIRIAAMQP